MINTYLSNLYNVDDFMGIYKKLVKLQKLEQLSSDMLEQIEALNEVETIWLDIQTNTLQKMESETFDTCRTVMENIERQIEINNQHYLEASYPIVRNDFAVHNELVDSLENAFPIREIAPPEPFLDVTPWALGDSIASPMPPNVYIISGPPNNGGNWYGGGGHNGNWNNGGGSFGAGDFNNGNPVFVFVLYGGLLLVFIIFAQRLYAFLLMRFEKASLDLQKYLDGLSKKKDLPTGAYVIFTKVVALLTALLAGPEAFMIALRTFSNPGVRLILRSLRFLVRMAFLGSVLVGGSFYGLYWYKAILSVVAPLLDQMVNLLSGPANISLSILFLEKMGKTIICSYIGSRVVLGVQNFVSGILGVLRLFAIFGIGSLGVYVV